jgi:esterase/lipase superfamily enzyme
VAQRSGADRVHVIAHSMGADAVAGAIASMDPGEKVFDQIILAAPDIDADVFMSQIAPRLPQVSKRTTLYCSKNDWALRLSYHFNDSLRAGDSSLGPLIVPGLDTVDASSIDTELLGHSYYGNCIDILQDVEQLFLHNPDPPDRNLVDLKLDGPAWTFPRLLVESPR